MSTSTIAEITVLECAPGSPLPSWLADCTPPDFVKRCLAYFDVPKVLPVAEIASEKNCLLPDIATRPSWFIHPDAKFIARVCAEKPYVSGLCKNILQLPEVDGELRAGSLGMLVWQHRMLHFMEAFLKTEAAENQALVPRALDALFQLPAERGVFLELFPDHLFEMRQVPLLIASLKRLGRSAKIHLMGSLPQPLGYAVEFV